MGDVSLAIMIDDVVVGNGHREVNAASVKRLADSIDKIGLRHPITVRRRGDKYLLVAGRHRLEACKRLGREHVPALIVSMTNDEARLWEIAENLHRAELSKLERDEQIAEWIKITERLQVVSGKLRETREGRPGIPASVKDDLQISEDDARRAVKVASLSEEAKDAAREAGLDDNRSALLEAASKPTVAEQVAAIHQRHTAKVIKLADEPLNDMEAAEKQVAALMSAWNKAGKAAREEFLLRIEQPVMDRQFA
jgi:ParB-like chromosome segregation protein Spo0J